MKHTFALTLAAALTFTTARGAIVITEIMSNSAHGGGTNNEDWFELTNTGIAPVNITGWSWDDNSALPGSANFGSLTSIAPGASVLITAESLGEEEDWRTDWAIAPGVVIVNLGGTAFQNITAGGDSLNIYDNFNALVATVTVPSSTIGFTFEWDTFGNSLGLSVIGQNGAYQSAENGQNVDPGPGVDVGSPGIAVPEPGSLVALGGGLALLLGMRRRNS